MAVKKDFFRYCDAFRCYLPSRTQREIFKNLNHGAGSADGKLRVLGLEPKTNGLKGRCSTN
jgi:hypothetical protein